MAGWGSGIVPEPEVVHMCVYVHVLTKNKRKNSAIHAYVHVCVCECEGYKERNDACGSGAGEAGGQAEAPWLVGRGWGRGWGCGWARTQAGSLRAPGARRPPRAPRRIDPSPPLPSPPPLPHVQCRRQLQEGVQVGGARGLPAQHHGACRRGVTVMII